MMSKKNFFKVPQHRVLFLQYQVYTCNECIVCSYSTYLLQKLIYYPWKDNTSDSKLIRTDAMPDLGQKPKKQLTGI